MFDLIVSIVLYKTDKNQLKHAIESVLKSNLKILILLVDNSPTNLLEEFAKKDGSIRYIFNPSNPGFGASHNIALRESLACGIKYHLVLNADVYFQGGVLDKLKSYMDLNMDVGHVMPKVLYPDGKTQYLCKLLPTPMDLALRRFVPLKFWRNKRNNLFELRFTKYKKEMEVPFLSGCFMFLRVAALKDVGLFDEQFFLYGEDIDLTRRINEKYKTIFYPNVEVVHEHGKASYKNIKMLLIHTRNIILYFNKWGWFFDAKRTEVNRRTLQQLKYDKR